MQLAPPHACRRHCELVADLKRPIALTERVRECAIGPRRAVMARKRDEPRTAGTDLRDRARNIALTDRSPRRGGGSNGRLPQELRGGGTYRPGPGGPRSAGLGPQKPTDHGGVARPNQLWPVPSGRLRVAAR